MNTIFLIFACFVASVHSQEPYRREWTTVFPCENNDKIKLIYENSQANDKDFQFYFTVRDTLEKNSNLHAKFASSAYTELSYPNESDFRFSQQSTLYARYFIDEKNPTVLFQPGGKYWYMKSLLINNVEYCEKPLPDLAQQMSEAELTPVPTESDKYQSCGRRKLSYQEASNDPKASPGDWPWHVALERTDGGNLNAVCGGTLISKATVLTAAHCVHYEDNPQTPIPPQSFNVLLGKQNLLSLGDNSQRIQVRQIVVHSDYNHLNFDSDIALLILSKEADFNDYVQPICIWRAENYNKVSVDMQGVTVGWGFGNTKKLESELHQAILPKSRHPECVKKTKNLEPFSTILNYQNFCLETKDDKSPCLSDSGSGYYVFVPDEPKRDNNTGSWYIRGISSYSVKLPEPEACDPEEPVIYTDVAVYVGWMTEYIYSI